MSNEQKETKDAKKNTLIDLKPIINALNALYVEGVRLKKEMDEALEEYDKARQYYVATKNAYDDQCKRFQKERAQVWEKLVKSMKEGGLSDADLQEFRQSLSSFDD